MWSLGMLDTSLLAIGGYLLYKLATVSFQTIRARVKTTRLRGPPSAHWLYGVSRTLHAPDPTRDAGKRYEDWATEYGPVYKIPIVGGSSRIILMDTKAINHFYSLETWTYTHTAMAKRSIELIIGRGLLWADGESHKRQRRAMTQPFSNASIRTFTSVFYDSGYKVKTAWDALLEASSTDEVIEDVQQWMNRVSLDSIGIAGFSHEFGTLEGQRPEITEIFDTFGFTSPSAFSTLLFLFATIFPPLLKVPSSRNKLLHKLNDGMAAISTVLLRRTRNEKEFTGDYKYSPGQSIIGALMKAEHSGMSEQEVLAQMQVLILAGYETTSISMTWALLELALHPEIQDKLRAELQEFATTDPTYDDLTNGLPYLNAVTKESLRLHPPLSDSTRVALADDIIPLSAPIKTASGEVVDRLTIAKGTTLIVPIRAINRSVAFWGTDAKEFKPERWINDVGITPEVQGLQGYSHILTFSDGPRICLGKGFALAEFKAVLSVLIRNYRFAPRDGPETKVGVHRGFLPRPMIIGEEGARVPLRISRV